MTDRQTDIVTTWASYWAQNQFLWGIFSDPYLSANDIEPWELVYLDPSTHSTEVDLVLALLGCRESVPDEAEAGGVRNLLCDQREARVKQTFLWKTSFKSFGTFKNSDGHTGRLLYMRKEACWAASLQVKRKFLVSYSSFEQAVVRQTQRHSGFWATFPQLKSSFSISKL